MGAVALVLAGCDSPAEAVNKGGGGDDKGYYTIKFEPQGGDYTPPSQVVLKEESKSAARPERTPKKNGNFFQGWFLEEDKDTLENEYTFSEVVKANITLYAGWKESDGAYEVNNVGDWTAAVASINSLGNGEESKSKNYDILIKADIKILPSAETTFAIQYVTITLLGDNDARKLELPAGNIGLLLNIGANQTIEAKKLTLRGVTNNLGPLVKVEDGAFSLLSGAKLTGNTNTVTSGGGVYVKNGTFTMNSAELSGNIISYANTSGGGVYAAEGSVVTLKSSKITGNTNKNDGTIAVYGGKLTITDCEVSGNTSNYAVAALTDCEVAISKTRVEKNSHGIYAVNAKLTVDNSTVSQNSGYGMNVNGGTVNLKDTELSENTSYQVNVTNKAQFTMDDCKIINGASWGMCVTTGSAGVMRGGLISGNVDWALVVYGSVVSGSTITAQTTFVLENSASESKSAEEKIAKITKNTGIDGDKTGHGVHVSGKALFTMNGGEISDNYHPGSGNNYGAGLYASGYLTEVVMNGGSIVRNRSNAYAGVELYQGVKMTMKGGRIAENASTGGAGGVGLYPNNGTPETVDGIVRLPVFIMEGGVIEDNTSTGSGAGVYLSGYFANTGADPSYTTFIMKEGAKITGNKIINSGQGAGVYVTGGKFLMEGGTISGNTGATSGGGVYVTGANSIVTMSGEKAKISGNSAGTGGGVTVVSSGVFRMTNGTIHGNDVRDALKNTATTSGTGVAALAVTAPGTAKMGTYSEAGVPEGAETALSSSQSTVFVRSGAVAQYVEATEDPEEEAPSGGDDGGGDNPGGPGDGGGPGGDPSRV